MSGSIGTKDSLIDNAIDIFMKPIKEWDRTRAPRGLGNKLTTTRAAEETNTSRIFLDHGGLEAWLAYSLATEGKTHFPGRHEMSKTVKAFQALPFDDRSRAAVRLAGKLASDEVPTTTRDRIRFILIDLEKRCTSTTLKSTQPHLVTAPSASSQSKEHPPTVTHENQTVFSASRQGVAKVFGEYMCRAIVCRGQNHEEALITMAFPIFELVDCVMTLEIRKSEVERLVKDLFGLDMVSVEGVRHLILGNGVRLTSNVSDPEVILKGVRAKDIVHVFGLDIYETISASKLRRKELEDDNNGSTDCVSMSFRCQSCEGALINLCMDLKGGLEMRDKLYN